MRSHLVLRRPWTLGMLGITALFLLPRVTNLGAVLTVDEPLWQARAHTFIEAWVTGDLAKTFISGQPGVTTLWVAGLALPWNSLRASQTVMATAITVLSLVNLGLLRRLAGPAVALAAGVFLALDPFFIAHSRVVHTDALLGVFMLLTLLTLALAWNTGRTRYIVYGGIATALSGLSKLFGFFLLLPAAFTLMAAPDIRLRWSRERLRRLLRFGVAMALTLLVLWPVLLVSPRIPLAFMTQRVTLHSQEATVGKGGGDLLYYPREFFRRLSPVVTVLLPLVAFGLVGGTGKRLPAFPARGPMVALLATSALFVALLNFSEQKSDRYILVAHLALDIATGAALVWLGELLTRSLPQWRIPLTIGAVGIAGVFLARDVWVIHPHTLAHWNRLLPIPADAKLGWGEGLEAAAAYLRSLNLPPSELTTASYYPGVLAHFLPGVRVERFIQYESPDFHFVVLYRSMYGRDPGSYETVALKKFLGNNPTEGVSVTVDGIPFRLEKIVRVGRLPYVWIFRRLDAPRQEPALPSPG